MTMIFFYVIYVNAIFVIGLTVYSSNSLTLLTELKILFVIDLFKNVFQIHYMTLVVIPVLSLYHLIILLLRKFDTMSCHVLYKT